MRAIVVLDFEISDPEEVAGILTAIDPPHLPKFAGSARISVGMPANRVLEYLECQEGDGPVGAPTQEQSAALQRLERLTRDFDHYARHGDPDQGADAFFRTLHGHLSSLLLLAAGKMPLTEIVDELERHDRNFAQMAIADGLTSAVGSHRPGSAFGL